MLTLASSTVMIDGLDITQSGHSQTGTGLISIYATSSSVDVTIRDVVGVLTPDQSLISSARHTGISVINVADVLIENSDITINNGPNSQISDTISINSSAPQLLDSSGAIIRNNVVRNNTSGGHIILIGEDGSSTSSATEDTSNNAQIYGNTVIGSANSTTVHGIMLGNQTGGEVYNNIVENTYIAYLGKGQTGGNFHHNIDVNIYGHSLRSKASTDMVFYNNTIILPGDSTEIGLYANHDDVTNIYSEDIVFDNNLIYALDDISAFSVVDATSSATFNNNSYYATNPQDFNYGGVVYDLDGWHDNFESTLQSHDPLMTDINGEDYTLQDYSPNIDAGTSTEYMSATETDYESHPIYGTPDIGVYEYQPTLEIGNDDMNAGGDVRIYGDGKFRYLSAPAGVAMSDLTVTPVGGFASYSSTATRPEWMNISDITWNVDGVKSWTASSSVATSTIYTVGDLTPGSDYEIKVDGYESSYISGNNCVNGVCTADEDGKIAFTYSGGYSTHAFSVTEQVEVSSGGSSGSRRRVVTTTNNTTTSTSTKQVAVNSPAGKYSFVRDLKITMYGQDVIELQKFLNTHGYVLAVTGPGSVGNETNYFGALTQNALIKFQRANGITPAIGYFGPITRAFVSSHY